MSGRLPDHIAMAALDDAEAELQKPTAAIAERYEPVNSGIHPRRWSAAGKPLTSSIVEVLR